jgi:hypothetical protein
MMMRPQPWKTDVASYSFPEGPQADYRRRLLAQQSLVEERLNSDLPKTMGVGHNPADAREYAGTVAKRQSISEE